MATLVTGAFGCIGAWVCKRLLEAGERLIAFDGAKGTISHVEQPIPFPSELADIGYQRDLGPAPRTGIKDGIRRTLDEFAALHKAGRLDARELDSAP